MRIIKTVAVMAIIALCLLFPLKSYAAESDEPDYGQDEVEAALPDEVSEFFSDNGITSDNSGVLELSVGGVLGKLWELFCSEVTRPLRFMFSLIGVILLCALIEALRDSSSGSSQAVQAFRVIGVLAGSGMLIAYLSSCLDSVTVAMSGASTFLATFIPIFGGIMAVNGQIATATVFNSVLVISTQLLSQLMTVILLPLSTCVLGISAAGAVNPELHIDRLAEGVKKIVVWVLGLLMTVFTGLLSLQSFVTSAADSVTMKAAKFAVSGGVPIVGGAISDALSTVKGSLGIMRGSIGTFGIAAGIAILAPTLMSLICYKLALVIAGEVSGLFGTEQLTSLIKSGSSVLSIVLAMLFCFMTLAVIAIAVMLFIGSGVSA